MGVQVNMSAKTKTVVCRFDEVLSAETVTLGEVQACAFAGVPDAARAQIWQLLLNFLPMRRADRAPRLSRARQQYADFLRETSEPAAGPPRSASPAGAGAGAGAGAEPLAASDADAAAAAAAPPEEGQTDEELRAEISKDIGRTNPDLHWFSKDAHTAPMRRILFVYAKLNAGVRYVQGMNEILAPLWYVIATDRVRRSDDGAGAGVGAGAGAGADGAGRASAAEDSAEREARLLMAAEADKR